MKFGKIWFILVVKEVVVKVWRLPDFPKYWAVFDTTLANFQTLFLRLQPQNLVESPEHLHRHSVFDTIAHLDTLVAGGSFEQKHLDLLEVINYVLPESRFREKIFINYPCWPANW